MNDDRYSLKLDIMSKISFHFRPFINIPRLIFNQYDLQIDQLNVKYSFEMKLYQPYYDDEGEKMCVNMYLNIDEVPFLFQ